MKKTRDWRIIEKAIVLSIAILALSAALGWRFLDEQKEEERILRNNLFAIRDVPLVASLATNVQIRGFNSTSELDHFKKKLFRIEKISFANVSAIHKYVEDGYQSVLVVEDISGIGKTLEFRKGSFAEWRVHRCSRFIACR